MFQRYTYYTLKPFLPWSVRIALKRWRASKIRRKQQSVWPINHAAGVPPEGWTGWPNGKRFALVLTHDVESERGLQRCRDLMNLERRLGLRSSFNFVPEGEYSTPARLRSELAANGFEVGVHDFRHDGKLYWSRKAFRSHARAINQALREWGAVGFRSGFMMRKLEWLHDLNILHDGSTFDTDPFEPQPEGTHTIFPFWVPGTEGRGYAELPYTLPQDSTLFILFKERSPEIWKRKLDWLAQSGGMALLIAHPDYMRFERGPCSSREYPASFYQEFLEYAQSQYAGQYWLGLPREVAEHTRQMQSIEGLPQSAGKSDQLVASVNL